MKSSDIEPTAWKFGASNVRTQVLMRKWRGIRDNVRHMEELLLTLMENPQTTPEQLSQAATLYSDMTKRLHESARAIDEYIGKKPETEGEPE